MEIEQMLAKADKIADYYVKLQQKIFYLLIDSFKTTRPELINQDDPDSILEWRLRALSKIGALTKDTIKIVSNTSGKSESYIYDLIKDDGLEVAKDINAELSDALKQNKPISPEVNSIISSYAAQTFRDINNNVNQSLLSTNYSKNGAVRAYQDIINQTVLEVQTGLKTPDRALKDNIYKWRDNGIKTNLVDKAGHNWSLEGYTRTVIRTTAARTYNDLRIQSMKDFDSVLATMSSHPASRPACAPIQGKIVNIVPKESPRCDPEYPSIYDYGYGKPSGCFGINCGHKLYPYIKGVSHNFQKQYDPKEAVEKQKIQQKQRYYERNIRRLKYDLDLARRQNDVASERKFSQAIRGYQAKLRDLVKNNDFLTRQYDREQIVQTVTKIDKTNKTQSQLYVETMLKSGQWGKKINPEKQAPHIESTRVEGKSYLYDNEDPQALMDKYAGKGKLNRTKNGFGNKEVVYVDHIIGIDYNSGEETNWIKIHHSKKRTHIVPYKPKE
ncbi:phage minor capsid protein [Ligilactobacillus ruminis]|uniref:phage minor capsid protein n=1 Tax=Ligilactobacillus ruminis TaxID=1623 RepID=UPI001C01AA14|nr:phage minor capsid protein [Ligilactobacillus ruminis]MBT9628258.1 minor capsid protein [Ligilactobacillus ruminis]